MALTKKQIELDKIKWLKSEEEGKDACGSFDYCVKCDKTQENPCDKAYTKYNKAAGGKKAVKSAPKKTAVKKPAAAEAAATAVKKTAKKSAPKNSK